MTIRSSLMIFFVIASAASAFGQSVPKREVSVGYSFLREEFNTNRHGWLASFAENVNPWFGVKAEVGGNYQDQGPFPGLSGDVDVHSILAGPQFTFTRRSRIVPWSHFLLGVGLHQRFLYIPTNPTASVPFSNTNFVMQPGVGIDYWLGSKVGVRVGGDYRRAFRGTFNDVDSFRLHAGIVFKWGSE